MSASSSSSRVSDYGRSKGIAWYSLNGFGLVHAATASEARVVKWDSAV